MAGPSTTVDLERLVARALAPLRGQGLVMGVSGGADSVALLRLAHAAGPDLDLALTVAHLHHGVRGQEADADAHFVAELARGLHLRFVLGRWMPTRSTHFEADARRARYAWLAATAAHEGAAFVVVGHTTDDQAETILHRILRGTGPDGLAGMPVRRQLAGGVTLFRPLLAAGVTRDQLRAHLQHLRQPWRDDASNLDLRGTRARLRHDLLPRLAADYNPRVAEALLRLGRLARQSTRLQSRPLDDAERECLLAFDADRIVLDRQALARLPIAARTGLLRRLWTRAGWPRAAMSAARWTRLARAARQAPRRTSITAEVSLDLDLDPDRFTLNLPSPMPATTAPAPTPVAIPGSAEWLGGWLTADLEPSTATQATQVEVIDLDGLSPPLVLRPPVAGDRLDPLGLDGQTQPLADFFRSRHIPREARPGVPLLCDQRGIVLVVGHRIAHRVRRTPATSRLLHLAWHPADTCD